MTANSARSRRKSKLEPISLAELADTPGMSGFCTFLTRTADEAVQVLDRVERETASKAPPVAEPPAHPERVSDDAPPEPEVSASVYDAPPVSNSPSVPAINKDTAGASSTPTVLAAPHHFDSLVLLEAPVVFKAAPVIKTASPQIARRFQPLQNARVKAAVLAQDGHTMAEQIIFSALCNAAEGQGAFQDVAVGNRWIMARTGLSERTVQLNLKSLQLKLSIEILRRHNPDTNEPTVYRVYNFESILDRRRAAGLDMVAKKRGGGVRLLSSKPSAQSNAPAVSKA
ncbi:MAG: hypothetical protein ABI693_03335 [Bryobacteraceae bacterium]